MIKQKGYSIPALMLFILTFCMLLSVLFTTFIYIDSGIKLERVTYFMTREYSKYSDDRMKRSLDSYTKNSVDLIRKYVPLPNINDIGVSITRYDNTGMTKFNKTIHTSSSSLCSFNTRGLFVANNDADVDYSITQLRICLNYPIPFVNFKLNINADKINHHK
ncbi:hypothetical protein [Vibrio mediterranei]|uniref:hypothetical protein n=1 Tax=Vibrio mediterranei TaxID=689 RepID=UPI00148B4438|nr:hypothetical protein [Vibrio mediterranei]NOI26601.1 hypothetical protein [Vibrio mediterranei]